MLIYNTTYTLPTEDTRNFLIWIYQVYLPIVEKAGILSNPKLLRVLSHRDETTDCFSLQLEAKDSASLHNWYMNYGQKLASELVKMFDERIVGFSTLLEEMTSEQDAKD